MNKPLSKLGIRIFYENPRMKTNPKFVNDPLFRRNDTVILQLLDISPNFQSEIQRIRDKYSITPDRYDIPTVLKYEKGTSKVLDALFEALEIEAEKIVALKGYHQAFKYLVNPKQTIFYLILLNVGFVYTVPYRDSIKLLKGSEIETTDKGSVYIKIGEQMSYDAFKAYVTHDYKRIGRLLKFASNPKLPKLDIEDEEIELLRYKFSNTPNKYRKAKEDIAIYRNKDEEALKKLAFNKTQALKQWGLYPLFGSKLSL